MSQGFRDWCAAFRPRAEAAGLSAGALAALDGAVYLPEVIDKDRHQPEVTNSVAAYVQRCVNADRIAQGAAAMAKNADLLARIKARYGVEKRVVAAIWGIETAFGRIRGDVPTISALATLAFDGRRAALFEAQVLAALQIIDRGIDQGQLIGSWAGAMGHTQFMPTSYLDRAVAFDHNSAPDIWGDDPADALASAAAYLAGHGWQAGQPWGVEVTLPEGFDLTLAGRGHAAEGAAWLAQGVRRADGLPMRGAGRAWLWLPAGIAGPKFLCFPNFDVIRAYNAADSYALAVGLLSDRLGGRPAPVTPWPDTPPLRRADMAEVQTRLTEAGFDTQGADGLNGPNTTRALIAFQEARGMVPDGHASYDVLQMLRGYAPGQS